MKFGLLIVNPDPTAQIRWRLNGPDAIKVEVVAAFDNATWRTKAEKPRKLTTRMRGETMGQLVIPMWPVGLHLA
ncbi:hypothetical protein V6N13_072228 [Hibiscus sabdariffa]